MVAVAETGAQIGVVTEREQSPRYQSPIFELQDLVRDRLSPEQRKVFNRIFETQYSEAPMEYDSPEAAEYVAQQFGVSEEDLRMRRAMRVENKILKETTIFNPMRAKRPIQSQPGNYVEELKKQNPPEKCVPCHYKERTPKDPFGRIEGKYSSTYANAAPFEGYHSVVFPRDYHNPLETPQYVFDDMVQTADELILAVYRYDPEARYPFIIVNLLPRAGSSVYHPHVQVLVAKENPYKRIEEVRDRMAKYQYENGYPYSDEFAYCQRDLGLVYDMDSAHIIFNLTARKEKEVVIYDNEGRGLPNGNLSKAIFSYLQWGREELGDTSKNMAIYMPPVDVDLKTSPDEWNNFFPFARTLDRGKEGVMTSDFGAMEIYGASVVASDPFKLAQSFREYQSKKLAT